MTSQSNEDDRLSNIKEALQPPSRKERLDGLGTRKALLWVSALVALGLILVSLFDRDSSKEDEVTPEREHISKQRISLDDPNARKRGLLSSVVGPVTPQGPQVSPEELARLEYLSFQIGGPIRVASGGKTSQVHSGPVSGGRVASVSTDTTTSSTSGYGTPSVSSITATVRPQTLWHNENRILEGKRMAAILETPIDTTLPGPVRAIFTEDVYSESGDRILIPRYSEALGTAGNTQIQSGQDRVGIAWHRLLLRTGSGDGIVEVRLDSPATDSLGRSGVKGNVKTHFWARFGNALLYTLIGTTASNVADARSESQNAQQAYLEGTTDAFRNTAQESLREQDVHEPTITVPRATTIMIVAAKDILFGEGQVEGVR